MEVAEDVSISDLLDLKDECPFDHELDEPPTVNNDLQGVGGTLATNMNNGTSTRLHQSYAPATDAEKTKWGKLPQKREDHVFYKKRPDKGRCVTIKFEDRRVKSYPVSCSAHHLIPSQESLKDHDLLQYMCKKGSSDEHNHGYSNGAVWSDVGYNTNGSENGVYLPGSYAVGGGTGGLNVWYALDDEDDEEHDEAYLEPDKLPPKEYQDFLIRGKKGDIVPTNPCWQYVRKAMQKTPGQFHDRHIYYSEQIVAKALKKIFIQYKKTDITLSKDACSKCEKRRQKIEERGLPAPYSVVLRLDFLSKKLRGYLTAQPGGWTENIYTSEWVNAFMKEVIRKGNNPSAMAAVFRED